MQEMKISLETVLVSLWIPGLLSLELIKYETFQKFEGLECSTITGQAISGLSLTRCLAKAVKNLCWSVQTIPACECCVSIKANGPSFVYAPADRKEGEQCLQDSQDYNDRTDHYYGTGHFDRTGYYDRTDHYYGTGHFDRTGYYDRSSE
ncbi:unnamed protein product [Cyprideis torosa]|uniref:Uncharacterized protein n=1 Tax=Cyprideis torosa TaxID=163714 RepID=A0A7R8ZWL5_9CRUS|nr:unnamed protein product [Cyprideis torosa]CAG0905488.1 unnamed protein product [Cyprideis torosa]